MLTSTELLVLGNGPSLKDYSLLDFADQATLGMNAAYRFWQRIDWRPTYYCCLDDALIDTHKDAIVDLILEQRIERFFLSGRILEHHPELTQNPNVFYLDQFVEHWYRVRGKQFDLQFIEDRAFKTSEPDMLTTGAYSVRFGVYLGYDLIRLLGIDLTYKPIADVRPLDGNRLEMTRTPTENPNYFFDDYQAEGDQFNVANPTQHGRDLHFHSFVALRDDFIRNGIKVRLTNAAQQSRLFSDSVFPYEALSEKSLTPERNLNVQLLFDGTPNTVEGLSNVFALWGQSAFFPMLKPGPRIDLIIATAAPLSEQAEEWIQTQIEADAVLRSCFDEIRFSSVERPADLRSGSLKPESGAIDAYDMTIDLDENCIPLTCDWLGRLIDHKGEQSLFLQVQPSSKSFSDIQRLRETCPEAVIAQCADLAQKFADPKLSKLPASLSELVDYKSDQWSARKPDGNKLSKPSSILKSFLAGVRK